MNSGQRTRWSLGKVVTFAQSSYWPIVADGETVARSEREHQAAHIVLACNAHEKLVDALEYALQSEESTLVDGGSILGDDLRNTIRAALALVERK